MSNLAQQTSWSERLKASKQQTPQQQPQQATQAASVNNQSIARSIGNSPQQGLKWADRLKAKRGQATQNPKASFTLNQKQQQSAPEIGEYLTRTSRDFSRLAKEGREGFNARNSKLAGLQGKIAFSRDDGDITEQIKSAFPDAQFFTGEDGTNFANFDGQTVALNKSGISGVDVTRFVRDSAIIGIPSALTGGLGGAALGLAGRLAGAGVGAGAGSLATDALSGAADGKGDLRPTNALIAAGAGVAGEGVAALASRLAPPIIAKFKDLIGKGQFVQGGKPTPAAIQAFEQAGIPQEQITTDLINQFTKLGSKSDDPVAAARAAQAQALPEPIQLTTGQATQNPATLGLEESVKKGAFGDDVAAQGLAVQQSQQQGLAANADIIRQGVSNGNPITQRGAGASAAQAELSAQREAAKSIVSSNFKIAKKGKANISSDGISGFRQSLGKSLRKDFDIDNLPVVSNLLKQLHTPPNVTSVNLGTLENWRKRVSQAQRSAARGTQTTSATEAAALGKALGAYDEAINGSLSDAIVKGSVEDIKRWRGAIASRKEFANKFENVPIINKLTSTEIQGGSRVLKVDPADAAAEIFGRSALGFKRGLARDLGNLKKQLSPQSWGAIKDEATLNLFAAADGTIKHGTEFAKRYDLLLRDAPEVLKTIFDPKEAHLIQQLASVAKTIERQPKITGNANGSGTAAMNAIISNARKVGGPVGEFVAAYGGSFAKRGLDRAKIAESSRYFAGVLARRTVAAPVAFRAVGIEGTNEGIKP